MHLRTPIEDKGGDLRSSDQLFHPILLLVRCECDHYSADLADRISCGQRIRFRSPSINLRDHLCRSRCSAGTWRTLWNPHQKSYNRFSSYRQMRSELLIRIELCSLLENLAYLQIEKSFDLEIVVLSVNSDLRAVDSGKRAPAVSQFRPMPP